jgi:predicted transposase YdaD
MRRDDRDRVRQALRFGLSLVSLELPAEEREIVSAFYFSYRPLSEKEALQMEEETAKLQPEELRQSVIEATNPWELIGRLHGREEGRQEGRLEGRLEGRQEGRREGLHDGAAETLLRQLRRRFGVLTADHEDRVRSLTSPQLEDLADAVLDFGSPADLTSWLDLQGQVSPDVK